MVIVVLPASCNNYFHSLGGGYGGEKWPQARRMHAAGLSVSPTSLPHAHVFSQKQKHQKSDGDLRKGSSLSLMFPPTMTTPLGVVSGDTNKSSKGKITHTFAFITFSYLLSHKNQQLDKITTFQIVRICYARFVKCQIIYSGSDYRKFSDF